MAKAYISPLRKLLQFVFGNLSIPKVSYGHLLSEAQNLHHCLRFSNLKA